MPADGVEDELPRWTGLAVDNRGISLTDAGSAALTCSEILALDDERRPWLGFVNHCGRHFAEAKVIEAGAPPPPFILEREGGAASDVRFTQVGCGGVSTSEFLETDAMRDNHKVSRRGFIETAGVATGAVMAAGSFPHPAVGSVKGSNEKINIAVLGPGGRAQEHLRILLKMKNKEQKPVDIIGLCDVWDGAKWTEGKDKEGKDRVTGRGLYYSAEKCGLDWQGKDKDRVTKDYRKILECKDVDAVLIATPDHWHAKMSIDAMEAGKDVYCEKPMTHTIDEARRVAETTKKTKQVFTVGVQSTADPRWRMANQMINKGEIGHVMQGQTSYYRNSSEGQWRYYPLLKEMTPKTVDWKMFLGTEFGLAPDQPFNRARYAQWRCYWDFGGGMYTDLFVHQLTHLILAMGVRFPSRVVGAGGLYLEYDGRDVPDMATVVADYDEGCQVLISATMANDVQLPEVIRGHNATLMFEPTRRGWFPPRPAGLQRRSGPSGRQQRRRRQEVCPGAARRGHPRLVGSLPRVHPFAQPRDPLPGRARLRGDRDGQPGRPVVP